MIPAKGLQGLHRCDNPPCCRLDHLEIGPPKKNSEDMVAKGRQARGERVASAKLRQGDADEIRHLNRDYGIARRALARRFGVNLKTIQDILKGKIWQP
jgi:hypothetical protein